MKGDPKLKLNPDCIRDILITVESMEYNTVYTLTTLCQNLSSYSKEELNYHCIQLIDAGLLNAKTINFLGQISPELWRIFDLTYSGHQFLADIRSDTTWNKTKQIAKSIGSESLHAIKDIAIGVVTTAIKNQFDLP